MRITRKGAGTAWSLLAAAWLVAAPASAFDPEAIFGRHFDAAPFETRSLIRPAIPEPGGSTNPLLDTAFFRFIDRLPFEPTSIGPEPKLPFDPEPAMGLVFVVSLD